MVHSRKITTRLSLIAAAVTLVLLAFTPSGAEAGTSEESPVAVPFIGDYEVWCTDRNPAPGNLCRNHHGSPAVDIGMDPGTPLYAAGDGVVIDADDFCPARGFCNNGKGNSVIIEHADGRLSRYLHMADVSVENGQIMSVGDPIGTSGESGQSSSPHLHYDEHFPIGVRNNSGTWLGCVDDEVVRYPDAFGTTDWNEVPFGSRIINEDWNCIDGVDPDIALAQSVEGAVDAPRILAGTTNFGVTSASGKPTTTYDVSIDSLSADPEVVSITGNKLILRPATTGPVQVRIREQGGPWSDPVSYDPADSASDAPTCLGLFATQNSLTGTPGVDVLIGTNGGDVIDARGGDDVVCGEGGNDTITAGLGRDRVFGGAGNDQISGGKGFDIIRAEDGDDSVRGGEGNDLILGGSGEDELLGNAGRDQIEGGPDDDMLIGGIGHDKLDGNAGDDVLEGRNGRDTLMGGNGADVLQGNNGRDWLHGGFGPDVIDGGELVDQCIATSIDSTTGCEQ